MRLAGEESAAHVERSQGDLAPSLCTVGHAVSGGSMCGTQTALQEYGVTLARWKNTTEMRRKYEPELGTLDYWVVVASPEPRHMRCDT